MNQEYLALLCFENSFLVERMLAETTRDCGYCYKVGFSDAGSGHHWHSVKWLPWASWPPGVMSQ